MCCCFFSLCINEMLLKSDLEKMHINDSRQNQPPDQNHKYLQGGKKDNVTVLVLLFFSLYFPVNMTPIIRHFNSAPL